MTFTVVKVVHLFLRINRRAGAGLFKPPNRHRSPHVRSVSEICKCAGVSRQTFYTLFESKDNVIAFELERKYCFRPEEHECCQSSMSLEDICHAYSYYITERRDILGLLVRNDILYLLQESLFNSFLDCTYYLPECPGQDRVYAADFLAGGLAGFSAVLFFDNM